MKPLLFAGLIIATTSPVNLVAFASEPAVLVDSENEEDPSSALRRDYLAYRGVLSTLFRDGRPVVFVSDARLVDVLPKASYAGVEINVVFVKARSIVRSGKGKADPDFAKVDRFAEELATRFADEPWMMGVGITNDEEGKYFILFRVSDPGVLESVPEEYNGVRVDVQIMGVGSAGGKAYRDHSRRCRKSITEP